MAELLLELFSEEIPSRMQARAAEDLKRLVTEGLRAAGLHIGEAHSFATPRRLTLAVEDVPARVACGLRGAQGPRVGAPEQAVAGFLKAAGLASLSDAEDRPRREEGRLLHRADREAGPRGGGDRRRCRVRRARKVSVAEVHALGSGYVPVDPAAQVDHLRDRRRRSCRSRSRA